MWILRNEEELERGREGARDNAVLLLDPLVP
jgi:hypothetical protein